MTPSSGLSGATAPATLAPARLRSRTMGRAGEVSSARSLAETSQSDSTAARSRTISANGFSSRCLRLRSAATAASSRASQARGQPPMPLSAPIFFSRRSPRAQPSGSSASTRSPRAPSATRRGPQAGQAAGCAWKRRSRGSSYSRRQSGHMANGAMVVRSRSYGVERTMVKRGPQLVQLRKGHRKRRSSGSSSSRRQSLQVATSGETTTVPSPPASLPSMRNAESPREGCGVQLRRSMRASGGGRLRSRATNSSSAPSAPSTSMWTPVMPLRTKPRRPSREARPKTNGLKPTPCTTPLTAMARRDRSALRCSIAYPIGRRLREDRETPPEGSPTPEQTEADGEEAGGSAQRAGGGGPASQAGERPAGGAGEERQAGHRAEAKERDVREAGVGAREAREHERGERAAAGEPVHATHGKR